MHQGSKRLHNMTAKLVVLLTKSEVTKGMIDPLGMFKFLKYFSLTIAEGKTFVLVFYTL